MHSCRHCGDEMPEDCPPDITSCTSYCNYKARMLGDMLPEEEAMRLTVYKGLCALDVAIRDRLELLPELD